MTVEQVDLLVRATTHPYPGAYIIKGSKKIIIWKGKALSNAYIKELGAKENILVFANGSYMALEFTVEEVSEFS